MATIFNVSDVFPSSGQPTITYVERDSGIMEKRLRNSISQGGSICLLTGPSKTGKSTLYKKVIKETKLEPIIIQCSSKLTVNEIWKQALEKLGHALITSTSEDRTKNLGFSAATSGKDVPNAGVQIGASHRASINNSLVYAEFSPHILVPILKNSNGILIIEDFHYLSDECKKEIFQQWKQFVDNKVSVLIVGTTHRATDIVNSNIDLIGRTEHFEVGQWQIADLVQIAKKGFEFLKVKVSSEDIEALCNEAVGLPIIVQQSCLQILQARNFENIAATRSANLHIYRQDIVSAISAVANFKYGEFKKFYDVLIRGPREKSRKYNTYELIVACFGLDPLKFDLSRAEIDRRLAQMKIEKKEIPPVASINSTLGALKKFQEKRNIALLEWILNEQKLYIIEPTFLFYLRAKVKASEKTNVQMDLFEELFQAVMAKISRTADL